MLVMKCQELSGKCWLETKGKKLKMTWLGVMDVRY